MREAYLFDAVRTPRGKGKKTGSLHEIQPVDLLKAVLQALQSRNNLDTSEVDDCLIGNNAPVGEQGGNIARTAILYADWHQNVPGAQVNRYCGSGLEVINLAAAKVRSGWEDMVVAGGVESMSRVPLGADGGALLSNPKVVEKLGYIPQGVSADLLATEEGFTREQVDQIALQSQQRALHAQTNGYFKNSLVPVVDNNGLPVLTYDEYVRPKTTLEILGKLPPSFEAMGAAGFDAIALQKYYWHEKINHVHHAGNSSGIVDGAAVALIGDKEKGKNLGLRSRAKIRSVALVGMDPTIMLTGPGPATKKALKKAGMEIGDIDLIEANEAFGAVVLKFMKDFKLDHMDNINVNGGAIALGHPIGATGIMLLGTLLDELERRDLSTGLVTMCIGSGMGIATIIERV